MIILLKIGVIATASFSLIGLIVLVYQALAFGQPLYYSKEKGSRWKGILYAFGRGMMPWEKESAAKHLPSYLAGVTYHIGILAALIYLLCSVCSFIVPDALKIIFQFILLIGGICGAALMIKRIVKPEMKSISCPDDYAANIIVDIFIYSALIHSFLPATQPLLYIAAIVMFLYIPLGKIRHCFFFFLTRIIFGTFFGRRNVFN